jgi:hypothetical protein
MEGERLTISDLSFFAFKPTPSTQPPTKTGQAAALLHPGYGFMIIVHVIVGGNVMSVCLFIFLWQKRACGPGQHDLIFDPGVPRPLSAARTAGGRTAPLWPTPHGLTR